MCQLEELTTCPERNSSCPAKEECEVCGDRGGFKKDEVGIIVASQLGVSTIVGLLSWAFATLRACCRRDVGGTTQSRPFRRGRLETPVNAR